MPSPKVEVGMAIRVWGQVQANLITAQHDKHEHEHDAINKRTKNLNTNTNY